MKHRTSWTPWVLIAAVIVATLFYGPDVARRISYAAEAVRTEAAQEKLADLSKYDRMSILFREVSKAVKPAVVEVRVTKHVQRADADIEEFYRRFFRQDAPPPFHEDVPNAPPRQRRPIPQHGLGSGVIVDAENGYVLTNWHVVHGADDVVIALADKRQFKAEWVRTDADTDLAVVKIQPDHLISVPLGDSDAMEVGDWVLAIGSPRGLPQTVTAGILSAKGRVTGPDGYQDFLQTDAAINQGNSGGPLVNLRGEIIGINSRIISSGLGNEGIGLSIPSNMVKLVMKQLIDQGKVVRGFLGVTIQDIDEKLAKSYGLETTRGALVSQVAQKTAAEKAGIRVGDFIVAVGGKAVESVNELRNAVAAIVPGKAVMLEVYRDGKKISVEVTVGEKPENEEAVFGQRTEPGKASADRYGLEVVTLDQELARQYGYEMPDSTTKPSTPPAGVLITSVGPDSDAAEQGLQPGMLLTHVQDQPVATAEEFTKALSDESAADGVRLRVRDRQGRQRIVFITPQGEERPKKGGKKEK